MRSLEPDVKKRQARTLRGRAAHAERQLCATLPACADANAHATHAMQPRKSIGRRVTPISTRLESAAFSACHPSGCCAVACGYARAAGLRSDRICACLRNDALRRTSRLGSSAMGSPASAPFLLSRHRLPLAPCWPDWLQSLALSPCQTRSLRGSASLTRACSPASSSRL